MTLDALKLYGANTAEGMGRCLNNESFYLKMVAMAPMGRRFRAGGSPPGRSGGQGRPGRVSVDEPRAHNSAGAERGDSPKAGRGTMSRGRIIRPGRMTRPGRPKKTKKLS